MPANQDVHQAAERKRHADVLRALHAYYGMVSYVDEELGSVLHTLAETGLDRNTLAGDLAAGVLWVTLLFAAMLGVNRLFVAEREQVRGPEVLDVDVVADAGAVGRVVVGAVDLHARPFAERGLAGADRRRHAHRG